MKIIVFFHALLSWLIPMIISMFFYDQNGNLKPEIDYITFKTIMIVIFGFITQFLL